MQKGEIIQVLTYYDRVKYDNGLSHPKMLSWDITNQCNLSCKHCLNNSGDCSYHNFKCELTDEDQIKLAHQIANLRPDQVCLCGGETLLNKNIYEIISIISSSGVMVNMVTNGTLVNEKVADKLKSCGISHVQISLDGLGCQHNIFRNSNNAFEKSVRGIRILKKHNIKVMVSCCPNKLNAGTIDTYIQYLYRELDIRTIRMMPLLPLGRASKECENLFLNSYEYYNLIQKIVNLREVYPDVEIEWGDPLEHLFLILLSKRKYPIVMSISSSGDLTLTPYIPIVLGNIHGDNLQSIWNEGYNRIWSNPKIIEIIRKVKNIYDLEQFNSCIRIEEASWRNA